MTAGRIVKHLVAATVVAVGFSAVLAAAPANAHHGPPRHTSCKKIASWQYYKPPSRGFACAYRNTTADSGEKVRQFRLYTSGVKRGSVWVFASRSGRVHISVCDHKIDGIGVYAHYQWQDSYNRPHYERFKPRGGTKCDSRTRYYSIVQYRSYLHKSDRYGTKWYRWPIGSF